MVFFVFYVSFIFMFLLVLKHPHNNVMHFSSANCGYFAFFFDPLLSILYNRSLISASEGNTEWGQQTVTPWTAIEFYVCMFYACSSNVFF